MYKQILSTPSLKLRAQLEELDILCDELDSDLDASLTEILREWLYISGDVLLQSKRRRSVTAPKENILRFPSAPTLTREAQ